MFAYFPSVYDDELLYSVMARLSQHIGSPASAALMRMIFGRSRANASLCLQSDLPILAANIPADRGLTVQRLIADHSLAPYFLAHAAPEVKRLASNCIELGDVQHLHMLIGVTAFRVQPVSHLRFCRECCEEMLARHGEMYWRRTHQLPSALVCPIHGTMLRHSVVALRNVGRYAFHPAHRENCPNTAQPTAILRNAVNSLSLLQEIALWSAALLHDSAPARGNAEWGRHYRQLLFARGFARSQHRIDQTKLETRFREHFGAALPYFPGALDGRRLRGDWLAGMVRPHRSAVHPQFHLLFQHFCQGQELQIPPFGVGPWPCLNPVANHGNEMPITTYSLHANHGHQVAVFHCGCGYTYTRSYDPVTTQIGPPRFSKFGPTFVRSLTKLLARGKSLRQIGASLDLDPKTIVRLADDSNMVVPWKTGRRCSKSPAKNKAKPKRVFATSAVVETSASIKARTAIRDWKDIDAHWLDRVRILVAQMYREDPPVRVCLGSVERRANARGWLAKRMEQLPLTSAFLKLSSESVSSFQRRRIRSIISAAYRNRQPIRPWEIMRMAGLRSDSLPLIKAELYTQTNTTSWRST
jgi:hypothetical protein